MTFTLSLTLPFDHIDKPDQWLTMDAVRECAQAAEAAGFYSGTVTDHPVPSYRWLDNGGHYAQDPFVMLSMVAAVTTSLRVQTNIIVLPYRNPFITARAVSSLDVFSNGRVILGMGAGYLKPEYKALGVDFDNRNDLMDEYIRAMKLAWTGEELLVWGGCDVSSAAGSGGAAKPDAKPGAKNADTAFRFAQEGAVNVFYWVDGPFGYALSSDADRSVLARVSAEVYQQLGAPR